MTHRCKSIFLGWFFKASGEVFALLLCTMASLPYNIFAQPEGADDTAPLLVSVFPLSGRPGTLLKTEIRGQRLDAASGVWVEGGGIKGRVLRIEEAKDEVKLRLRPSQQEKKPVTMYRAVVDLDIEPATKPGMHALRIITPAGISNPCQVFGVRYFSRSRADRIPCDG